MTVEVIKWDDVPMDEAFLVKVDGKRVEAIFRFDGVWMRSGHMDEYTSRDEAVRAVLARQAPAIAS